jgi:hypothetical protein
MPKTGRSFTAVPPKPERDDSVPAEPAVKRGWFDLPDGTLGIFVLLVLSSFCGAIIAIYWPFSQGISELGAGDRLSTLESKVDAMAAGHASGAAVQVFLNQRRELAALKSRLDADEARVSFMEKSENGAETIDIRGLKSSADRNTAEVRMLSDRLASLEQDTGRDGTHALADDRAKALHDQMSRFEQRITALEKSAPPAGLAQKLESFALKSEEDALESRVLQLEAQDAAGVMRRAAAVMALADLVRASAGSEPFADELTTLKTLAPASPEIQDLSRYASKGVPTRTMLADSFGRQADAILATQHANSANTWSDRIWSDVVSVISVRRIGNLAGNDPEAHVARAEVDLNIGELARAVREVSALTGPARDAAVPWLKSANERMNVDRDTRALAERLVANLSVPPIGTQALPAASPAK